MIDSRSSSAGRPPFRTAWMFALSAGLLLPLAGFAAETPDRVEELRRALDSPASPERVAKLKAAVKALEDLGDVSRALLLREWDPRSPTTGIERTPDPRLVDNLDAKKLLVEKFEAEARRLLGSNVEEARQLVVINLIKETSINSLSYTGEDTLPNVIQKSLLVSEGLGKLSDRLIELARTGGARIQLAAIDCLSRLQVAGKDTADAFIVLVNPRQTPDAQVRRAAAEAIRTRLATTAGLLNLRTGGFGREATGGYIKDQGRNFIKEIMRVVVALQDDRDSAVHRVGVEALDQLVSTLAQGEVLIPSTDARNMLDFGRLEELGDAIDQYTRDVDEIIGVLELLAKESPRLVNTATGANQGRPAREAALHVLEYLPQIHARVTDLQAILPELMRKGRPANPNDEWKDRAKKVEEAGEKLRTMGARLLPDDLLRSLFNGLSRNLQDPDVNVRLATTYTLDTLTRRPRIQQYLATNQEKDLLVPALVWAATDNLDRPTDTSLFVRIACARILERIATVGDKKIRPDVVVPGIVPLLGQYDLDLRRSAARILAKYGPDAAAGADALARVVDRGDTEFRTDAMNAVVSIGAKAAVALPAVARNLDSDDPRVRQAAAVVLGLFGEQAIDQLPALRARQNDESPEVRQAVLGAILKIDKGPLPAPRPAPEGRPVPTAPTGKPAFLPAANRAPAKVPPTRPVTRISTWGTAR